LLPVVPVSRLPIEATLQPSLIQPFCEPGWPLQPVTDHNIIRVFNGGFVANEHEPIVIGEMMPDFNCCHFAVACL